MGSVKDLIVVKRPFENIAGIGDFIFSDRYSVFDWGEMPDNIKDKGSALAVMAAFNFELLEKNNIRTHYKGLINDKGELKNIRDIKDKSNGFNMMQIDMAVVYYPIIRQFCDNNITRSLYDYSFFRTNRGKLNNYLIPLEIIFRNALPKGSSIFKKIAKTKEIKDNYKRERELKIIYSSLGLEKEPVEGQVLPKPIMDFTTKLEATDRSLTETEAFNISGLTESDFNELKEIALKINNIITEQCERTGLIHYDGKIEFIYNDGPVVCDVLGTFDENRMSFNNVQLSKEILRQWYKKNHPEFIEEIEKMKKVGFGWQNKCNVKPIKIDEKFLNIVSEVYRSGCNRYVNKEIFDIISIEKVIDKLEKY